MARFGTGLEPISGLNGDQCRTDGSRSRSVGQTEARYPGNGIRKGVMRDFEALLLWDAFKQRRSEDSNQVLIKQQLIRPRPRCACIVPQQVKRRELHVRVPLLRRYAAAPPDSYLGASFDDKHSGAVQLAHSNLLWTLVCSGGANFSTLSRESPTWLWGEHKKRHSLPM